MSVDSVSCLNGGPPFEKETRNSCILCYFGFQLTGGHAQRCFYNCRARGLGVNGNRLGVIMHMSGRMLREKQDNLTVSEGWYIQYLREKK